MSESQHTPVLLEEVITALDPKPHQFFIDCTLGGGGHARKILERTGPNGGMLGIDRDSNALAIARQNLASFQDRVIFVHSSYADVREIVHKHAVDSVAGILCDLGLSSDQLDNTERGFSYESEDTLDMRFDTKNTSETAHDILMNYSSEQLEEIFKEYGEERMARPIARAIAQQRSSIEITGAVLATICRQAYAKHFKTHSRKNPSTRVWQALRIAVNGELQELIRFLPSAIDVLDTGGKLAIISFHSLEDRIVKQFFKKESTDCLCPPSFPVCRCNHKAVVRRITKTAIKPTITEFEHNQRSRSALLRVVEKI